jgi:isopenicillin-N epimerase
MPDWSAARRLVPLDPTVTMLNTGSFGPTPTPVFDRVTELRRRLAAGPTDFFVRQVPPLLWESRSRTAEFLGTSPERFAFTTNVSVAINIVASSLVTRRCEPPGRSRNPAVHTAGSPEGGGEILMTDHEYGAMEWTWERMAARTGTTIRKFALPTMALDPAEVVAAAEAAFTPNTRVFFFSHVLSPTGLVLPAKELCALARRRGAVSVVDGAHAPAMIPLHIDDVHADYYTGNLHKWLLAPIGCGFLAWRAGMGERLEPPFVSWGYHPDRYRPGAPNLTDRPDERDDFGSTPRTRFLEFDGTRDVCPWLAVPAAIDFQAELGWDAVRGRMAELAAYTRRVLGERHGLKLATPDVPGMHGAMTAFELPHGLNAGKLRAALWDRRIEVPIIDRPDRLLIRVSHHFYTTEAEIDVLSGVLPDVVAASRAP